MVFLSKKQSKEIFGGIVWRWAGGEFSKEVMKWLQKNVANVWKDCSNSLVCGPWTNKFAVTPYQKNCRLKEIAVAASGKKTKLPSFGAISFSKKELLEIGKLFRIEIHADRVESIIDLLIRSLNI